MYSPVYIHVNGQKTVLHSQIYDFVAYLRQLTNIANNYNI